MIGRAGELSAVLGLIQEAVRTRRPRLVTVTGAAGIGKTRLVHEVVARQAGLRVLHGRCLAAGDGITFWALGEILRAACGIPLGEADARTPQRLRSRLQQILAGLRLPPAELNATIFALATTAAIRLPGNPLDEADPRDVADELGRAWPRLATAFAAQGPLLLVVEDLHWAGAPLIGMLSRLVTRSTGPVVVLTTARPEFLESRPDLPDVSLVSLRSLPADDSRTLLDALPQASRLDPRRRAGILARAGGNPYFLAQLAAHATEDADDTLPDTLHALLAARVDALPAPEKRLLRTAAVMGRVFWTTPPRDRLGPELPDLLTALENRGLVRARPSALVTGQDEYAFEHALLRDVAYGDDHETAYDGDRAVRAWREAIDALRDAPGHGDRQARLCLKTAEMVVARWGGFRVPADPALGDRVIEEGLTAVTAVLDEVALFEQEGRDRDRALSNLIAGLVVGAVRGDYQTALGHAYRAYEWARDLYPHDRLHGTAVVMICLEQLGRDAEIDPYLDEHLRLRQGPVAAMSCPYIRSGPLVAALALTRRGDRSEAEKAAATVEPDLDHPGNAEVLRARLALQRSDIPTARALTERLVAMHRRPGPEEIPHEALVLVQTLEVAGDHEALRLSLPQARQAAGYLALLTPACDHAEASR